MHNLLAQHSSRDPAFFVTQFMEGLQRDIHAAVVLHQPQTLDTAVDLSCLQEEVVEVLRRDDRRHPSMPPSSTGGRALPAWLCLCHRHRPSRVARYWSHGHWRSTAHRLMMTSWWLSGPTGVPRGSVSLAESSGAMSTIARLPSSCIWWKN